jgi:ApeA-like protein/HEPN superfamily Apea-like protein
MQAFECMGQWWLPERENDRAAGTLKVSQSGVLRLRLVGSLGPAEMFKSKRYPIILGWVEKSPAGDIVTLSGCMVCASTVGSATSTRENYHVSRAYFGAHLKQQDDFTFKSMSLQVAGLSDWAHDYSGFVTEVNSPGNPEEPNPVLSYAHRNPLFARVPGGRLTLSVGLGEHLSHRERSFRESIGISICCETAKSSDELSAEYVYPLQNLMTFVCDRPQEVEDFTVRPGEFPKDAAGRGIRIIGPSVLPEEEGGVSDPVPSFHMLFTLSDVEFSEFVDKWFMLLNKYIDAFNLYFGLQYGPPAYLDMTFPSVVQSLYLYYSRRDDGVAGRAEEETRLKEILSALPPVDAEWIVDRLGARPFPPLHLVLRKLVEEHSHTMNPLVSSRQDRFVNEVINTLKYIVLRDEDMHPSARHGADLYWMIQKLRFLFKSCLLRELGFKKEKVIELFRLNSLYQHVCRLEATEEGQRQQA